MAITKCLIWVPRVNQFTVPERALSQCGRTSDWMVLSLQELIMFTTVKTFALTLSLTILAAAPAMAAMAQNGIWSNGVYQNGVWDNGVSQNGLWENGVFQNGLWENGVSMNGFAQAGQRADTHTVRVIGIELPSKAVVR